MALALERMAAAVTGAPARRMAEEAGSALNVSVIFTSVDATLGALKAARRLLGEQANQLGGHITLIVPQIVPYPLPLSGPPASVDFNERRLRIIAGHGRIETRICIYLCRDSLETLKSVLEPHSLVIIGSRRRWWPSAEKRLAARLRRAGHEVIVTERD